MFQHQKVSVYTEISSEDQTGCNKRGSFEEIWTTTKNWLLLLAEPKVVCYFLQYKLFWATLIVNGSAFPNKPITHIWSSAAIKATTALLLRPSASALARLCPLMVEQTDDAIAPLGGLCLSVVFALFMLQPLQCLHFHKSHGHSYNSDCTWLYRAFVCNTC